MTRIAARGGIVRTARLTDLAAVGDLSRLASDPHADARSLGLPVAALPISVFGLFALPLGAFRASDRLYVHVDGGAVTGLARLELEPNDEATIVELDAIGAGHAGDIRLRLVEHMLRDAGKRGVVRFHVACSDAMDNVELFMQAGFARYGEERVLYRPPEPALPEPWTEKAATEARIRHVRPVDANALMQLYAAITPPPVQRLEAFRIADWERQGSNWRVPRSSLAPILRFADLDGYVLEGPDGVRLDAFIQIGVAREDQPHYLRLLARPEVDPTDLIRFGLGEISAQIGGNLTRHPNHGVLAPVRTYESPADRRVEEAGFAEIATVTLLLKETLVRVAEPSLVPAAVRHLEVTRGS
jgi:hypothetical protein